MSSEAGYPASIIYAYTRIHVQNLTSRRQMEEIVHDVSIPSGWALCPRGGAKRPNRVYPCN